jgi:hypothetical protein
VAMFLLREYWLDVGRMDDFERARSEFAHAALAQPDKKHHKGSGAEND